MAFKKIILKAFLPSCYKPNNQSLEPKLCPVSRNTSYRRLFLSDISDSSASTISDLSTSLVGSNLHIFTHRELKKITQNFCESNFLGEGGFGQVYKGFIDEKLRSDLEAQPVAVKILDLDGSQGHREWLAEVIFLGQLKHTHLVNLVGYCCEDEHRLLVYEYMARGDLDNQLFKSYTATLPWLTRLKIAIQAAKGLAFLHEEEKQVIYRDFKASNILLDHDFTAKLSDFGLAIDGPEDNQTHVTTPVMGTEGYAAPEYILTGHLTTMSDVYSFGVVLLEILTGKRCIDKSRSHREQNLVDWAKPIMKDPHKLERLMDPKLEGQYSTEGARKSASLAYKCLSPNPKSRPTMRNVVKTLERLMELNDIPCGPFVYIVPTEERDEIELEKNGEDCNKRENKVVTKQKQEENMVEIEAKRRQKSPKGLLHKVKSSRSSAVYCDTVL